MLTSVAASALASRDIAADGIEFVLHIVAQRLERTDENNCDQCRYQTIFNGCSASFVLGDFLNELFHWTLPSDMRGAGDDFDLSPLVRPHQR